MLSVDDVTAEISSVQDLTNQNTIQYGCKYQGSTMSFFERNENNNDLYRRMHFHMTATKPSVFTSSNDEGMERVREAKGKYAYFMESSIIEYITQRNCDLEEIGEPLDHKGYGIAMRLSNL